MRNGQAGQRAGRLVLGLILAVLVAAGWSLEWGAPAEAGSSSTPLETSVSVRSTSTWTPAVWAEFLQYGPTVAGLPDFSRAGYALGERPLPEVLGPVFDVTAAPFGAVADDGVDDTVAIQAAVDAAGAAGGGVVLLPHGRLLVHCTTDGPVLQITQDNVVLRGQGSGPNGSVLFLGAPGPDRPVRRLGSVPGAQEARHVAAISVLGSEERRELAAFTAGVVRGQQEIAVTSSRELQVGMTVVVECHDETAEGEVTPPAPDAPDLPAQLTRPFRLIQEQNDTFGTLTRRHSWITQVEAVPDAHTVRFAKPARFDQLLRHGLRIYSFEGVRGVGIEHLRIESAWPGGYRHHKPFEEGGTVVRTAKEQDYLWNGIWMSSVVHGWVRDVIFQNLTQGVILSRAAQITIEDIRFEGQDGHAGVTFGWSNDNLLTRALFQGRMVHPVTVTMLAAGNVITDCETLYEGRAQPSGAVPAVDLHGLCPYENLFDNLRGFSVIPGGDLSVMPHGGVRNVFWNVVAPKDLGGIKEGGDSFVQSWAYAGTSSGTPKTMFEHLPQAFYIGVRRLGGSLSLGESYADRRDRWMTCEGLNRPGLAIPSLYQAQRELRLDRGMDGR